MNGAKGSTEPKGARLDIARSLLILTLAILPASSFLFLRTPKPDLIQRLTLLAILTLSGRSERNQ